MCNHYYHERRKAWLEREILGDEAFSGSRIDVFPDRIAPVLCLATESGPGDPVRDDAALHAIPMRWGFPPPPSAPNGRVVTNLRNLESAFWRRWLVPAQRCLVPFTCFAEYTDSLPRREVWFGLAGQETGFFAGVWREWNGVRGTKSAPVSGEHRLFAILTCEPNADVLPVHAKAMPVILTTEASCTAWLTAPLPAVPSLAIPAPDGLLRRVA